MPPEITHGDSLDAYGSWTDPTLILSDGAYGIGGFDGDPPDPSGLVKWYEPHIRLWSQRARSETTLWFWNTELGWATVHPLLASHGWVYEQLVTWDKGMSHVAGNVNSKTIRSLPVVTEVCGLYRRPSEIKLTDGTFRDVKSWLRSEWLRTGLPMSETNVACGVKNAATRKYFALDDSWYPPPPDVFSHLISYANSHGDPNGKPYFQGDWKHIRGKWNHIHGITNVWSHPPMRSGRSSHPNQKPDHIIRQQILLTTDPGDVVWEPFGGTCPAARMASSLGRHGYAAEVSKRFYEVALELAGMSKCQESEPTTIERLFGHD